MHARPPLALVDVYLAVVAEESVVAAAAEGVAGGDAMAVAGAGVACAVVALPKRLTQNCSINLLLICGEMPFNVLNYELT